jgi:hypothetical protein
MTTYAHMVKVSQDPTLSNSKKLSELFGQSTGVVACNAGQTYIICLDGEFFQADLGSTDDNGIYQLIPFNSYDAEVMADFWESLLATDDTPLFFYEGFFMDEDLEKAFLHSF